MNLVGLLYTAELAIRDQGRPEQRYYPGAEIQEFYWLSPTTILIETDNRGDESFGWKMMDALTGETKDVAGGVHDHPATDFGVFGPDKFWYTTKDGQKHVVTVSNATPRVN